MRCSAACTVGSINTACNCSEMGSSTGSRGSSSCAEVDKKGCRQRIRVIARFFIVEEKLKILSGNSPVSETSRL